MGSFSSIFWFCFLFPFGIIFGALVSFLAIPILSSVENFAWLEKYNRKKAKLIITLILSLLFVIAFYSTSVTRLVSNSTDFWQSTGQFDYWRMPLEYPYHLIATGNMDEGTIEDWETNHQPVNGITRLTKVDYLVAGEVSKQINQEIQKYFIFNCENGEIDWYETEEEISNTFKSLGYQDQIKLRPVGDMINAYWGGQ